MLRRGGSGYVPDLHMAEATSTLISSRVIRVTEYRGASDAPRPSDWIFTRYYVHHGFVTIFSSSGSMRVRVVLIAVVDGDHQVLRHIAGGG